MQKVMVRARASWTSRSRRPAPAPEGVESQRGNLQPRRPVPGNPPVGPSGRPGDLHTSSSLSESHSSAGAAITRTLAPNSPRQLISAHGALATGGAENGRDTGAWGPRVPPRAGASGQQSHRVGGRVLGEGPRRPALQLGTRSVFKCWRLLVGLFNHSQRGGL